jgi:hypothetical protein
MSPYKKLTCKGTLRRVFIFLRFRTKYPPPPITHCILVYTIQYTQSHREGVSVGELNLREG